MRSKKPEAGSQKPEVSGRKEETENWAAWPHRYSGVAMGLLTIGLLTALAAGGCDAFYNPFTGPGVLPPAPAATASTQASVPDLDSAVALIANLKYDEAAKQLAAVHSRFDAAGDKDHAAEALFWLAYCYEKTSQKDKARAFYGEVLSKYPNTAAAAHARQRLPGVERRT